MTEQATKELTGQFSREATDYGYTLFYENSYYLNPELIEEVKAYKNLKSEFQTAQKALLKKINSFIVGELPKGFVVATINIDDCGDTYVRFKSRCEGMTIQRDDYAKKEEVKKKTEEFDAYQKLAQHHELKQILNCGVLTKAEKRKVLGLPALTENEELINGK